jgi:hypothetical protein
MRASAISVSALPVIAVARCLCASSSEPAAYWASGQPAVLSCARAGDVQVGDACDMHAARQPRLRQKHGAELAGPDHADRDRFAGRLALKQLGMEIHLTHSQI